MLIALTFGEPITGPAAALMRRVPRVFGHYPNVFLDALSREPKPSSAVLQGIFFGRTAPPREERKTFEAPALVLGHPRDVIHPFSDAKMLAEELPHGRLVEANSLYELRLRPRGLRLAHRLGADPLRLGLRRREVALAGLPLVACVEGEGRGGDDETRHDALEEGQQQRLRHG